MSQRASYCLQEGIVITLRVPRSRWVPLNSLVPRLLAGRPLLPTVRVPSVYSKLSLEGRKLLIDGLGDVELVELSVQGFAGRRGRCF